MTPNRLRICVLLVLVSLSATLAFISLGCGGALQGERPAFTDAEDQPVCLVLSVGDTKGLAHIGAIKAAKDAGLNIRYVVGNSMGALIGSMYATEPKEDLRERYRAYISAYIEETQEEATGGVLASLFGLLLAPVTGGASLLVTAVGIASFPPEVDYERTITVLNWFYKEVAIEDLEIAFATFYYDLEANKNLRTTKGNLAKAVGKSMANPRIYPGFNAVEAGYLDPGTDRVSKTPIEDACNLYPNSRILAVNVTGEPAYYSNDLPCPVLEVRVELPEITWEAIKGDNKEFNMAVAIGELATKQALVR